VNSVAPIQKKSIRFRARSFVAFALAPEAPLKDWLRDVDSWIANSPGFFDGRPVVLDLTILKPKAGEIGGLVSQLAERGIRIYAIEASGIDALGPDLPPLLRGSRAAAADSLLSEAKAPPSKAEESPSASLLIESPVRSGQSIFHPQGDVIVLGSVGSGSEIVAAGSIHVYGALRGRAFAGAAGNAKARIFCRKNEAELLAVDGWYLTAERMDPSIRGGPVQAYLDNGVMQVTAL
jgi:septum site-determining protein MinC